ncbi:MAG: bifunctional methylenetetrahydrofolate dehydrogenase/methenyltetrahydrofolate cyclohydrolase FolD [Candidatus Melainabacteria bacterium]|nr:bifunctional methylenetetrahydrofolate dehydrogenase/methenyltetrahydrofolate cyclohydrolase FolD [Candidatus Melainabacteria bacterium]
MIKTDSPPLILNGRQVADEVLKVVSNEISLLKSKNKRVPGLAVVIIGNNPASLTYIKNKEKVSTELGIYSKVHNLPATTSEEELISEIIQLNNNNKIDGILVQLPLPAHIRSERIIETIDPKKDVDGLHPYNLGKLFSGQECLKPCTPQGIIEILKYYSINLVGKHSVIIGRSILVGKPLAALLLIENSTVTITHSKTKNIEEISKTADILISAIGKANLIKNNWIKKDAIVIDVGINRINENGAFKIIGDVDFNSVKLVCKAITPVPGGVGPLTIAMLMKNTIKAYKLSEHQ